MKLLFICNQNKNRSKTAEHLFSNKFNTKSAGLYNQKPVTAKEVSWADTIIVMEEDQRTELAKRFPRQYAQKRILSFDIPDVYDYNNPKLVSTLKSKAKEYSKILT
ncbi:MAG TPA: phosphotyrosine protein phosphatase [Candidatus Nanoarchaeia archaeon]|nr:phosphotyrosine protein phosphatase [Candidatus Nanoarchaeia archaeon]